MMKKKDYSTNVGGRRKAAGSKTGANNTAGNSTNGAMGKRRNFGTSKTTAVARENKRFAKTRTRRGRKDAVS